MFRMMSDYMRKHRLVISKESWRDLGQELVQENLFRLIVFISIIFIMEIGGSIIFLIIKPSLLMSVLMTHNLRYVYMIYFGLSIPYLAVAIFFYRNSRSRYNLARRAFIYTYFFIAIFLSILMSLNMGGTTYYSVGVLLIAGLFCMLPRFSFLLFFISYATYFFLLPSYLVDSSSLMFLRIIMLVLNLVAWIFNHQIYRARVIIFQDKMKIIEQNEKLERLAIQDSMTRLYNHKHSYELLNSEVNRSSRYNLPLSVLLLDIDHFKNVNDTFGHQTGDRILKSVADLLRENTRTTDIVGRYGGEEFIVIMPDTPLENAYETADRLRMELEKFDFTEPKTVTISGGVAAYSGETAVQLVDISDKLLYEAKKNGRNRIEKQAS